MDIASNSRRTAAYKPALAWFAVLGAVWVFVLVTLGAFTTTIGAGMAFPDWPLSNGSVNPHGWLTEIDKFAEHSHRLSGITMGLLAIVLAVCLQRTDSRTWLRKLGWWALVVVCIQGLIGGQRVKLDAMHVPGFEMTLGQMLRIPHGVLAQVYVCMLVAIAVSCSKGWIERKRPVAPAVRHVGTFCCLLLFVQLTIAAIMRHNFAGLAIPTFPYSTPDGHLLPAVWSFPVGIHFAHRVMAVVIACAIGWFAFKLWTDRGASLLMRSGASTLVSLVGLQILLGAGIIWTSRSVALTTGHVLTGALTLATTFWLTWLAHRDAIEESAATTTA